MLANSAFRKIDRKIYIVFLIVIAIAIVNAIYSTYTIRKSQEVTNDLVRNTNPSLDNLAQMNLMVTRSRMLITNWVYLPNNQADKDSLRSLNNNNYTELRTKLKGLMVHWHNEPQVAAINHVFNDYDLLVSQEEKIMRLLMNFEDYQDPAKKFAAEDILEREIIPMSENIAADMKVLITTQTEEARKKQDEMMYQFNYLAVLVLGIALLIIGSILFAAFVITRSIIIPVLQVRNVVTMMGRGELPELNMKFPKNVVGEMLQALRVMIEGFRRTAKFVEEVGKANFDHPFTPLSENDEQGHALLTMKNRLKAASEEDALRSWLSECLAQLNIVMRASSEDFNVLLDQIIDTIVDKLQCQQAAIFLLHNDDMSDMHIQLGAYYALNNRILNSKRYELKEGLVGQSIVSKRIIMLENIADPFFTIETGFGESKQCNLMIIPLITSGKVVGAIEVASVHKFTNAQQQLLEKMAEPIAASVFSVRANLITAQLLEESRKQAEELVYQEQELRKFNNELTKQSQLLQQSEEELKAQQEELKQVNQELQDKAALLEEQNIAVEDARQGLAFKAQQLEQSNKYKSAFLANMSHELRTPLNSILILAKLLADNRSNNLDEKQIEHTKVIHKSGSDLLNLINDILDLSKIESGKVELQLEEFKLKGLVDDMHLLFRELASEKQINFKTKLSIPDDIALVSDKQRIEQVVKNLLSNAFKFTPSNGTVELTVYTATNETPLKEKSLLQAEQVYAISVRDTGIGIPADKQNLVFEAFKQADGSTSRKFGGTGLGLAISRELSHLMGGDITLESSEGTGSTFTLYLPARLTDVSAHESVEYTAVTPAAQLQMHYGDSEIRDDRNSISKEDKSVLIIEDDYVFARMMMNHCHRYGFKAIIALQGDHGLQYARQHNPFAIILDMRLPVMDGWTVLKELKADAQLKHIPVHVVSSVDKPQLGLELGAATYMGKPTGKEDMDMLFGSITSENQNAHKILFVGDRREEMQRILAVLKVRENAVLAKQANSIDECVQFARQEHFTCLIIDSNRADQQDTYDIVKYIHSQDALRNIPVVFCDGNADDCATEVEHVFGDESQQSAKAEALDETNIFLATVKEGHRSYHQVQQKMDDLLKDKTVLLVDDDMRNIYSMTNILEHEGLNVISAYDGLEALARLKENPQVEIVLMDIMMPNMNGYDAIIEIRKNPDWQTLPIIAVTAKAMNGDREKCMEAGASDYLTKPFQTDQLISLMRVWMYK